MFVNTFLPSFFASHYGCSANYLRVYQHSCLYVGVIAVWLGLQL